MSVSYKYFYDLFLMRNTFETEEKAVEKCERVYFHVKELQLCANRVSYNGKNRI